ncbi:MAG: sugar phosphorylase [Planctomycetota bacterium]
MHLSDAAAATIGSILRSLYGEAGDATLARLDDLAGRYAGISGRDGGLWDERDVVLITYGDQVAGDGDKNALSVQRDFLVEHDVPVSTVHLLPFCPYTSDDGFSVVDYRAVADAVGTWDDVAAMRESFDLMYDLVLNHCSASSEYFRGYLAGDETFRDFFIDADPADERLTRVTRPRSLPLLTEVEVAGGETRYVWTTFSADQVDLNFAEPDVLVEMLDVLLGYVARGARIVRLDAIAYLWKELGTPCIHLPQTHAVVKLMRALLDDVAPGTILLTETNVPHAENVSYFGDVTTGEDGVSVGDEAQMVYQFSLAPLLLDAFVTGDPAPLNDWLRNLEQPSGPMTFLNFTASHDGVGVRPLEGLVTPERRDALVDAVKARGGHVSTKRNSDGSESPYELNITYFAAMADPADPEDEAETRQIERFLASQAVMLALRGIPAVYFHSLVATSNHDAGVAETGRARTINRRKFARPELEQILANTAGPERIVFDAYRQMLAAKKSDPAFHPDAAQEVFAEAGGVIGFVRTAVGGGSKVVVLCNPADEERPVPSACGGLGAQATDTISGGPVSLSGEIPPRTTYWLQII